MCVEFDEKKHDSKQLSLDGTDLAFSFQYYCSCSRNISTYFDFFSISPSEKLFLFFLFPNDFGNSTLHTSDYSVLADGPNSAYWNSIWNLFRFFLFFFCVLHNCFWCQLFQLNSNCCLCTFKFLFVCLKLRFLGSRHYCNFWKTEIVESISAGFICATPTTRLPIQFDRSHDWRKLAKIVDSVRYVYRVRTNAREQQQQHT